MIEIAIGAGSFVVGVLLIWLGAVKSLQKQNRILVDAVERLKEESHQLQQESAVVSERNNHLQNSLEGIQATLQAKEDELLGMQQNKEMMRSRITELETTLDAERMASVEKLTLLEEKREEMKLEFKVLADKVLEQNSEKFSKQNQENLGKMISPIKEQFDAFKKQIDDVYIKEAKDRSMLQAEIKSIKEINLQMSTEAKNLTNALKGESKTQGVWGEMILESVLEHSGLRLGEEYEREVSLEHDDGTRYRPDVVVHLPDARDIIIDSKTSLTAYEQYVSSSDLEEKEHFATQHIASIKSHIKALSDKEYTNLKNLQTLDFIFMFVPIESALLMALEYDNTLFDHAFKQGVILVGPTTLMVSLRAVENSWKYEHQQKNALDIAKRAGLLYDKFVSFVESIESIGKQLGTVQKSYEKAYGQLHQGAGSITTQFQKLEKLGAAASKKLPEHILRQIEE